MNTNESFPSRHAFVGETVSNAMTRRDFAGIAAAALLARPCRTYTLQAIAAERIPHTLVIQAGDIRIAGHRGIFELREYESRPPDLAALRRCGIEPIRSTGATLLIPFESLEARDRAWTRFNVEHHVEYDVEHNVEHHVEHKVEQNVEINARRDFYPRSISIYRMLPA
jgi:hypothetical protein